MNSADLNERVLTNIPELRRGKCQMATTHAPGGALTYMSSTGMCDNNDPFFT